MRQRADGLLGRVREYFDWPPFIGVALLAVIAQQLVPAIGHVGRYPAVEVMMATPAIRNLIRIGKDHQLRSHISTGRNDGMITMDQSLAQLVPGAALQAGGAQRRDQHLARQPQLDARPRGAPRDFAD